MDKSQTTLVVGADGNIGSTLVRQLELSGHCVTQTTRRRDSLSERRIYLDLANPIDKGSIPASAKTAFFCAGEGSLEFCASHKEESRHVNVEGTVSLARALLESGTRIVFLSTNRVFDGSIPNTTADHPTCPQTEYGRQKVEAEKLLMELADFYGREKITILRATKVLSENNQLINQWLLTLKKGKPIHPPSNLILAPVTMSFLVAVLVRLTDLNEGGVFQVSAPEDITYEQMARHLAGLIDAAPDLVRPRTATGVESAPAHTTLDSSRLQQILGVTPMSAWQCLNSVVAAACQMSANRGT